ncbi:MAG: ribosome maturation factor RimM [Gammaproteobacteria bacterium]
MAEEPWVVVGRVAGLYGLKGWVKIVSYTEPRDNILSYRPWHIAVMRNGEKSWQALPNVQARIHGKGIVAQLEMDDGPNTAGRWLDKEIAINRTQLPRLAHGDYYWSELLGCKVLTLDGIDLGTLDHFFSTGANDVMVVVGERERLIPYIKGSVVHSIDLAGKIMRVDWDADF